jgi:protein SCO1/2
MTSGMATLNGRARSLYLCGCAALVCLSLAACRPSAPTGTSASGSSEPSSAATPGEKRYHLKGTVVQIDKAQQHLVIDHGDIPGFMAAMTMPYPVADAKTLDMVSVGDQVTADVVVIGDSKVQLENVVVVKKADAPKPAPSSQVQPGDGAAVPDFALVNQDGKRIDLAQYAGETVLMTFIYTRCPLPDYCPLVTHDFAQIERQLAQTPELFRKTHLLTVSFDSKYDTPAVLRNYAHAFGADKENEKFAHWEFATVPASELPEVASFFGIFLNEQDGQITHSMCTVVVSPDGKLYKQYDDNDWKPAEMMAAIEAATPGASPVPVQAASAR